MPGPLGTPWRARGGLSRAAMGEVDVETATGRARLSVASIGPRWWGVVHPPGRCMWPVHLVDVGSFRLADDCTAVAFVLPDRRVELHREDMGPFEWALRVGSWARRACVVGGRLQAAPPRS